MDNIIRDFQLTSDFSLLYKKKIVIYGAGERGNEVFEILSHLDKAELVSYCETDVVSWRRSRDRHLKNGLEVLSIEELLSKESADNLIFIIAVKRVQDEDSIIYNLKINCPDVYGIITWTAFYLAVYLNIENGGFDLEYQSWFIERNDLRLNSLMADFIDSSFESAMNEKAIYIYQPGKVGSFSIYQSLKKVGITCSHIHRIVDADGYNSLFYKKYADLFKLWKGKIEKGSCTKIITMVREPIMRSVSSAFQGIYSNCIENMKINENLSQNIIDRIRNDANYGKSGYMLEWFYDELEKATGIDIYQHDFDKEKGYGLIRKNNIEILVLSMEKMNLNADVIKKFVDDERMNSFKLLRENVGNQKNYRYLYEGVKSTLKVPDEILDFYYQKNEKLKHFYTETDIDKMKQKMRG